MNKKEIAAIKKLLTGQVGQQLDQANAARVDLPERLRIAESRQAAAKVLTPTLAPTTAKDFEKVLAADRTKLAAALKQSKAAAVKGSRGAHRVLSAEAARRIKGLQALAADPISVGSPEFELLNEPFLIWRTNSVDLEASEIIPSNSFAKFRTRVDDGADFIGDVKFFYLWSNPRNKTAVINVDGYIIFNGHISIGVGGGLFPGDRSASVTVEGRLDILEWFNQPPTSPPQQPDQKAQAASLRETAYGFSEVGAVDAKNVFRGFDLRHTLFLVPPLATIVFVVVGAVTCGTGEDSGNAEADFASGAFQIGSPAVLVTILS